tara:strand:+ start:25186 stop:26832 length:1647 start_codon:yes stop_codon:yes gene_type:complete
MANFENCFYPFAIAFALLAIMPNNHYMKNSTGKMIQILAPIFSMFILFQSELGGLKFLFAFIFMLISLLASINAFHLKNKLQDCASVFYAGSAIGVVTSSNWLNFVFCWEMMLVGSVVLILSNKTIKSTNSAIRYFYVHLLSGSMVMFGVANLPTSKFDNVIFTNVDEPYALMIFIGFLINAAAPPFHSWVPDSYPNASPTANVFLSAFTTKAAVYALIKFFPSFDPLIYIGCFMGLYGVTLAMLSNNIRKLLSYHIISQVGYMIVGIGIGTSFSLDGSSAHAFSHILYKGLLFMTAGALIYVTGKEKISEMGGLAQRYPLVFWSFIVGALSIAGAPIFNGFISKSMIVEAAHLLHLNFVVQVLNLASIGTFLSIGLKMGYYSFAGKSNLKPKKVPLNMQIAMVIAMVSCALFGVMPNLLYKMLPNQAAINESIYQPWDKYHVIHSLEIIGIAILIFAIFKKYLKPKDKKTDAIYIKIFNYLCSILASIVKALKDLAQDVKKEISKSFRGVFNLEFKNKDYAHNEQNDFSASLTVVIFLISLFILIST